MRTIWKRSYVRIILTVVLLFIVVVPVLASDLDVAVVDVTAPTGSVTLPAGGSGPITINISVTGNQAGNATFKVYQDWTLSGGTFIGSNPIMYSVDPRVPADAPDTFSTSGTVTVAGGQSSGTFTLAVSAFDITNDNQTGAKLNNRNASSYQVTVTAPPSDNTPPTSSIILNPAAPNGNNGWYVTSVGVTVSATDNAGGTGVASTRCVLDPAVAPATFDDIPAGCAYLGGDFVASDGMHVIYAASIDNAGNKETPVSASFKIDQTLPSISVDLDRSPAGSGWFNVTTGAPIAKFTCDDTPSGIASCPGDYTFGEGSNQSHSGTAYDNAGNSKSASVTGVDVDLTAPSIQWNGGPDAGGSYYFGFVPAAPTCTATDALSGPNGCNVTGYGTTVGSHTMTATAYDVAGNSKIETRTYTVLAWTLTGFYQPVNMLALNTVKGGSTVPLKFNVYAGSVELTDPAIVKSFTAQPYACQSGLQEDAIEFTTTGNTSLRYDALDGQFIQNWKTPKQPGKCYRVTMTTLDGSSLSADFSLK